MKNNDKYFDVLVDNLEKEGGDECKQMSDTIKDLRKILDGQTSILNISRADKKDSNKDFEKIFAETCMINHLISDILDTKDLYVCLSVIAEKLRIIIKHVIDKGEDRQRIMKIIFNAIEEGINKDKKIIFSRSSEKNDQYVEELKIERNLH